MRRFVQRFARSEDGSFGLWAGVAFPMLALIAFASVELASITHEKTRLQDVADAAALSAARELSMGYTEGVVDRAEGFALNQLADLAATSTLTADAAISGRRATVNLVSNRIGFFANLVPPGGFWIRVKAVAEAGGAKPLCVVTLQNSAVSGGTVMNLTDSAELSATGCLIHSNHDIAVSNASVYGLTAGQVDASGTASGRITPTATNGVAVMTDPFAGREFPAATCPSTYAATVVTTSFSLPPGAHCGAIDVQANVTITLEPGVHYFAYGHVKLDETSRITGDDVVLVFGPSSKFKIKPGAYVSLAGRRSGPYAGMVMVSTPSNTEIFEILSSNVDRLEGVIYLPSAALLVSYLDAGQVAEMSKWTVTVTKQLQVAGSAKLKIDTRYSESDVPVPAGVGSTSSAEVRLVADNTP